MSLNISRYGAPEVLPKHQNRTGEEKTALNNETFSANAVTGLDVWDLMVRTHKESRNPDPAALFSYSIKQLGIKANMAGLWNVLEKMGFLSLHRLGTSTMVTPDGKGSKEAAVSAWRFDRLS